jgi:hypothetical protein
MSAVLVYELIEFDQITAKDIQGTKLEREQRGSFRALITYLPYVRSTFPLES